MEYYLNGIASSHSELDLKTLIPDANMRRRMSSVVKMGVGTAMECIRVSSVECVDAVVMATRFGCLSDSEKFLKSILENEELLLNPTPFIQSTFNTIGGQIAILTKNRGYNMTYSHGVNSFESALLDTVMLLNEGGAKHVLVGLADELTPALVKIMERLRIDYSEEGAFFFMISSVPTEHCKGVIKIDTLEDVKVAAEMLMNKVK